VAEVAIGLAALFYSAAIVRDTSRSLTSHTDTDAPVRASVTRWLLAVAGLAPLLLRFFIATTFPPSRRRSVLPKR
jgi:hypothetical protein